MDGLPLAIELAAARSRLLTPAQILTRIHQRFRLLASGGGGRKTRQSTLRATLEWSWELLTPWEQAAFAQCSVFEGGFTLEAAEVVLDLSQWPDAPWAMDVVQTLVDKSLLRIGLPSRGPGAAAEPEPRFGMYISLQEYAREKLADHPPEAFSARARHGTFYAGFGTREALVGLSTHGGMHRWWALAAELDNLVTGAERSTGDDAASCCVAAMRVLVRKGPFARGTVLAQRVLERGGLSAAWRGALLQDHGSLLMRCGQMEDAHALFQDALEVHRQVENRREEGLILGSLGALAASQGQWGLAAASLERGEALLRDVDDKLELGKLLCHRGHLQLRQGHLPEAAHTLAEAEALAQTTGASPESVLGCAITELREALAAKDS